MSEIFRQTFPDDFGGASHPSGAAIPADVAEAVFSLVARHTTAPRVAVYPLPVDHVIAIHTGQRITTEAAAIVHTHLRALLQASLEPSWLMVETGARQLVVVTVREALNELIP